MISFYDGQITDLLPANITEEASVQAISYALREGIRLLYDYTQLCYVYCNIDAMPDAILDLMAKELRTQYYSDSMDIETKRTLVKNTLLWYTKAGTREAVEELVAAVFGAGEVSEWFEYGDDPYYFKITTSATLTDDIADQLLEMIGRVKNTRSHLRKVDVLRDIKDTTVYLAAVVGEHSHTTITNDFDKDEEIYVNPRALIAAAGEIYEDCEGNFGRTVSVQMETELLSAGTGIGCASAAMLLGHGVSSEMAEEQVSAATVIGSAVSAVLQ